MMTSGMVQQAVLLQQNNIGDLQEPLVLLLECTKAADVGGYDPHEAGLGTYSGRPVTLATVRFYR